MYHFTSFLRKFKSNLLERNYFNFVLKTCQQAGFFTLTSTTESHDKSEIHSGSTPSLQPRFGTFVILVVPKLEGDVKGSTFFIGCRS